MCPDALIMRSLPRLARRARGFAIVTAIFLLLLIATLTALVASFSTSQNITSTQDLQGARAYQAARAGIEWGVYQVLQGGGGCAALTTNNQTFAGLDGFTVTITRAPDGASPYTEDGAAVNICRVTSTAISAGAVGDTYYIEREIQVTF